MCGSLWRDFQSSRKSCVAGYRRRDAFERDGLLEMGGMGLGRMPRRNPFRSMGGGMMGGSSLLDNSMNNGMSTGSSNAPIKVTKME